MLFHLSIAIMYMPLLWMPQENRSWYFVLSISHKVASAKY